MSDSNRYDDDILLWSEQQAAVIRRLCQTRRAPNDLHVENVAEEIESVGRSELASVVSHKLLAVIHVTKPAVEPDAESANRRRGELLIFCFNLRGRYAPSMRQRIDMDRIWQDDATRSRSGMVTGARDSSPFCRSNVRSASRIFWPSRLTSMR